MTRAGGSGSTPPSGSVVTGGDAALSAAIVSRDGLFPRRAVVAPMRLLGGLSVLELLEISERAFEPTADALCPGSNSSVFRRWRLLGLTLRCVDMVVSWYLRFSDWCSSSSLILAALELLSVSMLEQAYPRIPENIWSLQAIGHGVSGIVFEISDSAIAKVALGKMNQPAVNIEHTIYQRLGYHPFITKFLYEQNGRLVLERLQYPLRKRLIDLSNAGRVPPLEDILRWALQLTEALSYIHSRGVLQVDIGAHNALLDWDENVKLSDFAGSSIDGSTPTVLPSRKSQNPNLPEDAPSVQSEIFALGSMLYEVVTTRQPYYDKSESELKKLFSKGEFPDTRALILGEIITGCWKSKYGDVQGVMEDIKHVQGKHLDNLVRDEASTT
ncbi:kinase-like domain-containing protein [Phaeosphaeriaceae sp. PMI808]|nr:kinase-like domain-containing protein [Phaeosphaeriaceae sp. PMI808]